MNLPKICLHRSIYLLASLISTSASAQEATGVRLVDEIKISDFGMFFDGSEVPDGTERSYVDNPSRYDYAFGNRITPHGDCIEVFGDYVFLTWYRGPESDRHVMLSRYNVKTGTLVTIEFEHRHTGFQNIPNIGESHNTIAVGICAIDQTVHLLYDMHAYSPSRPSNGSLANDYFRYQYSVPGAAVLPDEEFTLDKFFPKQLYLNPDDNYESLTYPQFFTNRAGELLVVMREGGNNNGKYQFARYDGTGWSRWIEFNTLNARSRGWDFNWGLYGDMKMFDGLFHIAFATRYANNNDRYVFNNGVHYAYSLDPAGLTSWFNAADQPIDLPVINPNLIKVSEPADVFPDAQSRNSIRMSGGVDWTVTPSGALHFVSSVRNELTRETKDIHTFRAPGETEFTISTDFPGGDLYPRGNFVYLIDLVNRHPVIHRAQEGTNNWETIYNGTDGVDIRHGNIIIQDDKLFYFVMEQRSGSAQPIYLQIYDLGQPGDAGTGGGGNNGGGNNGGGDNGGGDNGGDLVKLELPQDFLVGWDTWSSGSSPATIEIGLEGETRNTTGWSTQFRAGSADGTFGALPDDIIGADTTVGSDPSFHFTGMRSDTEGARSIDFVVTETKGVDIPLGSFYFDMVSRDGAGQSTWSLEVLEGGALTPGVVASGLLESNRSTNYLGNVVADLTSLADHVIEANQSVTFRLTVSTPGKNAIDMDNVGITTASEIRVVGQINVRILSNPIALSFRADPDFSYQVQKRAPDGTWSNIGDPIVVEQLTEAYVWPLPAEIIPTGANAAGCFLQLTATLRN